jgi:hypothetical protein
MRQLLLQCTMAARSRHLFGLLYAFLAAHVANSAPNAVRVDLVLTSGSQPMQSVNGQPAEAIRPNGPNRVELRANQYAHMWVADYDPILYSYSASTTSSPTESAQALPSSPKL